MMSDLIMLMKMLSPTRWKRFHWQGDRYGSVRQAMTNDDASAMPASPRLRGEVGLYRKMQSG